MATATQQAAATPVAIRLRRHHDVGIGGACAGRNEAGAADGDSIRSSACTASPSRCRWSSTGGVSASSQCTVPMKYSSDWVGVMFSIRSGTIGMPLLTARSTSRPTCGDWLAWDEKTRTMTRDWWMASTIEAPYSDPGMTSRGAIQQTEQTIITCRRGRHRRNGAYTDYCGSIFAALTACA